MQYPLIITGRPVTKHIRGKSPTTTFDFQGSSTKRPTLFHCSFFFPSCVASCRACLPSLPHRSGGDLSRSNSNPAKQRRPSSFYGGATRLPDIACPCLHLGLPCAVRPVSFSPLSFTRLSSPIDHKKLLEYRRSGFASCHNTTD